MAKNAKILENVYSIRDIQIERRWKGCRRCKRDRNRSDRMIDPAGGKHARADENQDSGEIYKEVREWGNRLAVYGQPEGCMIHVPVCLVNLLHPPGTRTENLNITEFIETLPEGYQTDMGQMSARLSGGERQRIGIARIFLRDPDLCRKGVHSSDPYRSDSPPAVSR